MSRDRLLIDIDGQRKILATVDVERVTGAKAVGGHQLIFNCRMSLQNYTDPAITVRDIRGNVRLISGQQKLAVGRAHEQRAKIYRTRAYSDDHGFALVRHCSSVEIEAIEDSRNGGDPRFELEVTALVERDAPQFSTCQISVDVEQSRWLKSLESMGYGRNLLFEVPLAAQGSSSELRHAVRHLKDARQRHQRGEYNDCVAELRKVYESLDEGLDDAKQQAKARNVYTNSASSRMKMTVDHRLRHLRNAAKHITHPPNHAGTEYQYTRRESQAYLGVTASLLSFYLDTYKSEEQ